VIRAIFDIYANRLSELKGALKEEIKNAKIKRAAGQISERKLQRDSDKRIYHQLYYHVIGKGKDDTFIMASDFQMLPYYIRLCKDEEPEKGIMYKEKALQGKNVIRVYYDRFVAPIGSTLVKLSRDDDHLYMDGIEYGIEKIPDNERDLFSNTASSGADNVLRDFSKEIDALADDLQKTEHAVYDNIFASAADKKEVKDYVAAFYKEMAFTRQDIGKIYD
ncbi:MAG: ATPase, partial [Prevotella sp.]|nr:ATPase [Prevotella sp.]